MKKTVFTLLLLVAAGTIATARTFTNKQGRKLEGDLITATADEVNIKRKDGRFFTLKIDILSDADQAYIKEFKSTKQSEQAVEDAKKARDAAIKKIVDFSMASIGKQVGNGECWTLANDAYQSAAIQRPGSDMRVWGREVDYKKEDPMPGDIVEIEAAKFDNGMTFPAQHTSVIVKVASRSRITVCEQNISGNKTVKERDYDLKGIKSGTVKLYRYQGNIAATGSDQSRFKLD